MIEYGSDTESSKILHNLIKRANKANTSTPSEKNIHTTIPAIVRYFELTDSAPYTTITIITPPVNKPQTDLNVINMAALDENAHEITHMIFNVLPPNSMIFLPYLI